MLEVMATPTRLGALALSNRIVMAPMTRNRANDDGIPSASAALYYSQRAAAGLIVTEGVNISPIAKGNERTPGIWTDEQVEHWRVVTDAVHAAGGTMVLQLWHTGRMSHSRIIGELPVGPSPIAAGGRKAFGADGFLDYEVPRVLTIEEIHETVEDYVRAARNALRAGFDGVEIHGANAYLPDQFLHAGSNTRTDEYGGSIENRCRFALEVTAAVVEECGADRVGYRMSPSSAHGGMSDPDSESLYAALLGGLSNHGIAYVHTVEPGIAGGQTAEAVLNIDSAWIRQHWGGGLIAAGNYDAALAADVVSRGQADAVAFGRPFIATPDLVQRVTNGDPLDFSERSHYYGGGDHGYIDFPTLRARRLSEELVARKNALVEVPPLSGATALADWEEVWAAHDAAGRLAGTA